VQQASLTAAQRTAIARDSPARPGSASASAMKSMQAAVDQAVGAVHEKGRPLVIANAEILSDPDEAESPTIRTDSGLDLKRGLLPACGLLCRRRPGHGQAVGGRRRHA